MEEKHALGQLSVVESVGGEHPPYHSFVLSLGNELPYPLACLALEQVVEIVVEGKLLDIVEECYFKGCGRDIVF